MYEPLAHHPHHMAAGLASLGRGNDKMLVHMTPNEVGGLRKLAMAAGGDLSVNPHTGLPEAGFLSSLLPMIAGGLLVATGVGAPLAAAVVGAGDTAITGSWKKGLMAGIGAYGGASLASGLGAAGVGANPASAVVAGSGATPGVTSSLVDQATGLVATPGGAMTPDLAEASGYSTTATTEATPGLTAQQAATQNVANKAAYNASLKAIAGQPAAWAPSYGQGLSNIGAGIGKLTTPGVLGGIGSTMGMSGVGAAALPVMQTLNAANQQNIPATSANQQPYYNTTYNPRTQTYSTGNWSKNFAGPGYTGAPGAGQTAGGVNSAGIPYGSYNNPYTGVTGIRAGGSIKHMASGGESSSFGGIQNQSALGQYFNNLINGTATTSSLAKPDPSANANYMAGLSQGTAPTTPIGSTSTTPWINSGYQAETAANAPTTATTPTTPTKGDINLFGVNLPVNLPNGADASSNIPSYTWNPATQSYGSGAGAGAAGSYTWNPATQSYTSTGGGYAGYGGYGGRGYGKAAGGGIGSLNSFAAGGMSLGSYSDGGRLLKGPGDGMSDDIPAHIHGAKPQPAALADGEFVIPADVVSHLGNGSTDAGSRMLYKMMDRVRQARTGNPKQGRQIDPNKFMPV